MMQEPKVLPVDIWVACFNLMMLAVWLPLVPAEPAARWLAAVHAAGLALPWLLAMRPQPDSRFMRPLRVAYPLLWACVVWREIDVHSRRLGGPVYDALILRFDSAVFGTHLHAVWSNAMPSAPFSELMQGVYFSYYLLLIGVPLGLFAVAPRTATRDVVLRIAVTYLVCFIVYTVFPTTGPLPDPGHWPQQIAHGWFFRLNDLIRNAGDSLGTAFPSSHVAGAVTLAWLLWRYAPRPLAVAAAVIALGVVGATVYTQNHYGIDALTGLVLAIVLQSGVVPLLNRPLRKTKAVEAVPGATRIRVQVA